MISSKIQKSVSKTPKKLERGKIKVKKKEEKTNKIKDIRSFFEKSTGGKNSVSDKKVADKQAYRGCFTAQPKQCDQQEEVIKTGLPNSTGQNLQKGGGEICHTTRPRKPEPG